MNEDSVGAQYELFRQFYTEHIGVFWLSDDVFISRHRANRPNGAPAYTYRISFSYGRDPMQMDLYVYVYALSSLERPQFLPEPSPLPMDFLRHLTRDLPSGHFAKIDLEWHCSGFPLPLLNEFLSIPSSANNNRSLFDQQRHLVGAPRRRAKTLLSFYNLLTGDQADMVLSYCNLDYMEIAFCGRNLSEFRNLTPEQAATKIRLFNMALRTATTVRFLNVTYDFVSMLFRHLDANDVPFSMNSSLEMLRLLRCGDHHGVRWVLDGVKRNQGIHNIIFSVSPSNLELLEYLLKQVIPGHASLKAVLIYFWPEGPAGTPFEAAESILLDAKEHIKKLNLGVFRMVWRQGNLVCRVSPSFQHCWDMHVAPVLALNDHRSKQQRSSGKRHTALELQCINRGVSDRNVATPPFARNMSPANASVIYRLLCETDQFKTNA
jgi:hypothetical protein